MFSVYYCYNNIFCHCYSYSCLFQSQITAARCGRTVHNQQHSSEPQHRPPFFKVNSVHITVTQHYSTSHYPRTLYLTSHQLESTQCIKHNTTRTKRILVNNMPSYYLLSTWHVHLDTFFFYCFSPLFFSSYMYVPSPPSFPWCIRSR